MALPRLPPPPRTQFPLKKPRIARQKRHSSSSSSSSSSSTLDVPSARAYCLDLLRKHDKPSHLLSAFQPAASKDTYLSLRAFNTETSLIPDQVSNTTLGRMRMTFWREGLTKIFTTTTTTTPARAPPAEPTLLLLSHALHANNAKLTKGFLTRVLAEREKYLGNVPFRSLDELEGYAEGTYGSLLYAALEGLGIRDAGLDHVASHIGKAEGIVAVIRGLAVLASAEGGGAVVLPLDVCAEVGVRQEDVLRRAQGRAGGGDVDALGRLKEVVFRIATLANDHLITARKMVAGEPAARGVAFSGFMRAVPTAIYLERLERVDFDPFDKRLQRPDWKLPWRAYRAYTTRKF